jgi:excisionase family DNA binding protein
LTRDQVDEYYLTVAEVAELLRLNQQTVRNWIDQGSLPALRVGRRVRIKQSDLDRLLSDGYSARAGAPGDGPSAEDFWGGEPVGIAEPRAGDGAGPARGVAETTATNGDSPAKEAVPAATNGDSAAGDD